MRTAFYLRRSWSPHGKSLRPWCGPLLLATFLLASPLARGREDDTPTPAGPVVINGLSQGTPDLSPDGRHVLIAETKTTLRVYDAATGKPVGKAVEAGGRGRGGPDSFFSADGKKLFLPTARSGRVWDPFADKTEEVQGPPGADKLAWEGNRLNRVVYLRDKPAGTAQAFDPFTGKVIGRPFPWRSPHPIVDCPLSPDRGTLLLLQVGQRSAVLWDLEAGKQRGATLTTPAGGTVGSARFHFSPTGKEVLAVAVHANTKQAQLRQTWLLTYDTATGRRLRGPLACGNPQVFDPVFSPDGRLLAAQLRPEPRVRETNSSASVQLWDLATLKPLRRLQLPEGAGPFGYAGHLRTMAFSPDGKLLAVRLGPAYRRSGLGVPARPGASGEPYLVQLFDVSTGTPAGKPVSFPHPISQIVFAADGKTFLTVTDPEVMRGLPGVDYKGQARLWKVPERSSGKSDTGPGKGSTDPLRKDR